MCVCERERASNVKCEQAGREGERRETLCSFEFDLLTLISSPLSFLVIMGHRKRIQGFRILYKNDKPIKCQKAMC